MIKVRNFMPCLTFDSDFYVKIRFIHDYGSRLYALFDF